MAQDNPATGIFYLAQNPPFENLTCKPTDWELNILSRVSSLTVWII